jgi:hypothetical protein
LKEELTEKQNVNEENKNLKQKIAKNGELALETLACRSPSPFYDLFLKEQWLRVHIERIVSYIPLDHKGTNKILCNMYFSSIPERRNLLCELYIHNYLLLSNTIRNPNHFVGDVNLREFMFVLENELKRAHEKELYKGEELIFPLWIRPETNSITNIFKIHNKRMSHPKIMEIMIQV